MSRLRRAALAAALAGTAAVAAKLSGISVRVSHPPQDGAATTTRGHLGLVRAHPGLRDLNAALAGSSSGRDALFLDAAHALAAGALRAPTFTGRYLREYAKKLAAAESTVVYRVEMGLALVHARDGRFDQALADVARLVADRPGDPHLRITSAALRLLHGRMGTPAEWLNGLPEDAGWRVAFEVVFAMPGSSPLYTQGAADRVVMLLAAKLAEAVLVKNFEQGEWSVADKLAISLLLTALRLFVSKYSRFPYFTRPKSTPPPPSSGGREIKPVNLQPVFLVECSQAMLASLLRARPLCGERLREARATAERALADAEAEGDDLAAVDKDPSDSQPYELAAALCAINGDAAESEAWRRDGKQHGRATVAVAVAELELPALLDELVVAAALGSGILTTLDLERGGRRRLVLVAAWREVDARLAAAVLDDDLTLPERVQLRLLRRLLRGETQLLLDTASHGLMKNSTRESD
ncbi:hypothetical protein OsJ_02080 [Oryza sativa Japonica Group]|uniref:Uncharacterized protein n=1 Tax=Oryza sativa subsp. japonica TaxID=39947 RepID=A2ZTZ8_ORYSJ|nr:hypothetical protein OsJ_02080 [Oryza sativa Japonica Group]